MESIWRDPDGRRRILFVAAAALVLLVLSGVFLVVLRLWPEIGVPIAVTALIVLPVRIYRHIQGTPPDSIERRFYGALFGAFVGGLFAFAYLVYCAAFESAASFIPLGVIVACGSVIGMTCPRLIGFVLEVLSGF